MTDIKILDEIAHGLMGQCLHDVEYFCEEQGITEDDLSPEDWSYIENITFYCVRCGWWCETSEMADGDLQEFICNDCYDGEDDDE